MCLCYIALIEHTKKNNNKMALIKFCFFGNCFFFFFILKGSYPPEETVGTGFHPCN